MTARLKRKVLIADDERLVRIGLRKTVNWERWNMEVVAEAPNGVQAWELYQLHRPDLVITDIVMPGMDGIELTRKIRETDEKTQILFLSCHRDFAYAQQGIDLGVCGYVLKTAMGEEEVDSYLDKIAGEWERKSQHSNEQPNYTFDDWLTGGEPAQKVLVFIEGALGIGNESMYSNGDSGYCYFVYYFDLSMMRHKEPLSWFSHVINEIEPSGSQEVLYLPHGETKIVLIVKESLMDRIQHRWLDEKIKYPQLYWKMSGAFCTVKEMLFEAEKMAKCREVEIRYGVTVDSISEPIMEAIRYIEQNMSQLSHAKEVADHVGLSRSHFSTVFKKEVGVNFLTYVHHRKLEEAKRLLKVTDWPVHLIAEKIGIYDDKYFSKWFKKNTGYPPKIYRNTVKN